MTDYIEDTSFILMKMQLAYSPVALTSPVFPIVSDFETL